MAERRMFAKSIVDSDDFLELSHAAQLLYFHLAVRADDDGFVNGARKILRVTQCADTDLQELIDFGFIIPFRSGVIVIAHWKVHNYIQKDRYHPTLYQDEFSTLNVDERRVYHKTKDS